LQYFHDDFGLSFADFFRAFTGDDPEDVPDLYFAWLGRHVVADEAFIGAQGAEVADAFSRGAVWCHGGGFLPGRGDG